MRAAAQVTCREDPTGAWVAWARAELTRNMYSMLVTLDMSKLSGWLNAVADCRVQWEAYHEGDMEGQETGGRWGGSPSNVQGRPDWCIGAWARAERT